MSTTCNLRIILICACLLATGLSVQADVVRLGNMQADKILFLGNSITDCPPNWWGLAASTPNKDYAHLLTQRINTTTGGSLTLVPSNPPQGDGVPGSRWYPSYGLPSYNGNILNIADIFERNYDTWDNARIQNQLNAKPNIVVLQFGENMSGGTMAQFHNALVDLVTGLKNSSNPEIFMTGFILGSNPTVDVIKQQVCAEDPSHRVFVNLSAVGQNPANIGDYGHPNDAGMALIANTMFSAMVTHSVPEPDSLVLLFIALGAMLWYAARKHKSKGKLLTMRDPAERA